MKVVKNDSAIVIFPLVREDSEKWFKCDTVIVHPDDTIEVAWIGQLVMDSQVARLLAEALLEAVKIVQNE